MLAQVEPDALCFVAHAQSHQRVGHSEQDEAAGEGERPAAATAWVRNWRGSPKNTPLAPDCVDCDAGKEPGGKRAQDACPPHVRRPRAADAQSGKSVPSPRANTITTIGASSKCGVTSEDELAPPVAAAATGAGSACRRTTGCPGRRRPRLRSSGRS
jgi:hypothetical protein